MRVADDGWLLALFCGPAYKQSRISQVQNLLARIVPGFFYAVSRDRLSRH